jgi:hypothetical protein
MAVLPLGEVVLQPLGGRFAPIEVPAQPRAGAPPVEFHLEVRRADDAQQMGQPPIAGAHWVGVAFMVLASFVGGYAVANRILHSTALAG